MASENAFKKRGLHLQKSNFKVKDTEKSVKPKILNDMFQCSKFSLYLRKTFFE